jgi:aerobic-type carbon monoxide dehydrogenase small subunit (CoxS/CutS family)
VAEAFVTVTVRLNGASLSAAVEPRTLLSDFIRHVAGLTATHVGCEHGVCGACTVLFDGQPARSCLMFAVQADGHEVVTAEGLAEPDGSPSPLQLAFSEHHALQCGFCTSGFLVSAQALLDESRELTEADVRGGLAGNLCRCTGYEGIVAAVLAVARAGPPPGP